RLPAAAKAGHVLLPFAVSAACIRPSSSCKTAAAWSSKTEGFLEKTMYVLKEIRRPEKKRGRFPARMGLFAARAGIFDELAEIFEKGTGGLLFRFVKQRSCIVDFFYDHLYNISWELCLIPAVSRIIVSIIIFIKEMRQ
ncbi:MAG: hypothetical protein LBP81_00385, partial [Treponema sp.]|nr:hypothetical protein [Treponema sp.]